MTKRETARRAILGMMAESPMPNLPGDAGATFTRLLDLKLIERTPDGMWKATPAGQAVLANHTQLAKQ